MVDLLFGPNYMHLVSKSELSVNCEDDLESILLFLFYLAKQKK